MNDRQPHAPLRNPSWIGWRVRGHSGEFAPSFEDIVLPGRGLDLAFVRTYRSSRPGETGPLGRGWSLNLLKRLTAAGADVLYDDGSGAVLRFTGRGGTFVSPPGLYGVLRPGGGGMELAQRFGVVARFAPVEDGGELLEATDRNGNRITFARTGDELAVTDTHGRALRLALDGGLVRSATDQAGRTWAFDQDGLGRLVRVTRPDGTTAGYGYDDEHQLVTIANGRGQVWLRNDYDEAGRVTGQRLGAGRTTFAYGAARTTACELANGGRLEVEHDGAGHAVRRTLLVRRSAFVPGDVAGIPGGPVPLTTISTYDAAGELVARRLPGGRQLTWTYAENAADPRDRGNLLASAEVPAGGGAPVVTRAAYGPFQLPAAVTDARGATTRYDYDDRGNLAGVAHPPVGVQPVGSRLGAAPVTERALRSSFTYDDTGLLTSSTDPAGVVTEYTCLPSGYLAGVTVDAGGDRVTTAYAYDAAGHPAAVVDGRGNATTVRCDVLGRVESVVGRDPASRVDYSYDEDANLVGSRQAFTRPGAGRAWLVETRSVDELGKVVERTVSGDGLAATERLIRDGAGRVIRMVHPTGETTEYDYDERDLVVERRRGVGTPAGYAERFAYDLDGTPRAYTDGTGATTVHTHDALGRYAGFAGPAGTTAQARDDAGDVIRVTATDAGGRLRAEARYERDAWGRMVRADRAWFDPADGTSLGSSGWDGRAGVVSAVTEYGDHGLPVRRWDEAGNIVELGWDGARRLRSVADAFGEVARLDYDENGNVLTRTRGGTLVERFTYDAMDRVASRRCADAPAERVRRNELGSVVGYTSPSGLEVTHTVDGLGRPAGHAYRAGGEPIGRGYEYDAAGRLVAYVDAEGRRTAYTYDALGRQAGVDRADGTAVRVERDAAGRVVRTVSEDGTATTGEYDAAGRLVAVRRPDATTEYEYDAAGRLLTARSGADVVARQYDSLGRLRVEQSGRRTVRYGHDAAGNLTEITTPGGDVLRRAYDARRRVTGVLRADGTEIARFAYDGLNRPVDATLAGAVRASWSYDARQRITSVEYRAVADGRLVDGFRYRYDAAGRMAAEVALRRGPRAGERYAFDEAGRPVLARYGVGDLDDPRSAFESEASYTLSPEGRWRSRRDVAGDGTVLADAASTLDAGGRYVTLGDRAYAYDPRGNRIREDGCAYAYDGANRLVGIECGGTTTTYAYDPLGRLAHKVVDGIVTEYTWTGFLLAEEYENGLLARAYVHGVGSTPVLLTAGGRDHLVTVNGRGLASGVTPVAGPNTFAERYGYELTGAFFTTEIGGVPVGLPERNTTGSALRNSLTSGDAFGSVLTDWDSRLSATFGGGRMDGAAASALNGLGDVALQGHQDARGAMEAQLSSTLAQLGIGGTATGPAGATRQQLPPGGPDWKLYADGDDGGTESDGGTKPSDAPTKDPEPDKKPDLTPATKPDSDPGGLKGGGTPDAGPSLTDKIKEKLESVPLTGGGTKGGGNSTGVWGGVKGTFYTDPESAGGGTMTLSPGQLEARFGALKHPVNPDNGAGEGPVDAASPPPRTRGLDPTVALMDPDGAPGAGLGGTAPGNPKTDTAPIDHVPGWEPGPPGGYGSSPAGDAGLTGYGPGDRFP